jgi:DNA-binding NtrC family response regulator
MKGKGKMETAEEQQADKWLFPPQLERTKHDFLSLLDTMAGERRSVPLMIMGDTGVGKSAFVDLFERHFLQRKLGKQVRRVNVAAIPETLVESALFGHLKGAFTGAIQNRKGLVESADLLVLEEIGELTQPVQAKLLTFIEDGIYYQIGADEPKPARHIQIVATTNRTEEDFRRDFYHRFFHFEVPPLYRRRTDVLHYFRHFSPLAYQELRPWEIMTLLCHNWPGNVREIETLSLEFSWVTTISDIGPTPALDSQFIEAMMKTTTGLSPEPCRLFRNSLKMNGIDVDFLEKSLNQFGLGLHFANRTTPLKDSVPTRTRIRSRTTPVKDSVPIEYKINKGLQFFTSLFWKSEIDCKNLLEERTGDKIPFYSRHALMMNNPGAKHLRLVKDCLRYIGVPGDPPETEEGITEFLEACRARKEDPIPEPERGSLSEARRTGKAETERDMLRRYYKDLLAQEHGNVANVAQRAGKRYSTLRDRLKKLELI